MKKQTQYKQEWIVDGDWKWFFPINEIYLGKHSNWKINAVVYTKKTNKTNIGLKRVFSN